MIRNLLVDIVNCYVISDVYSDNSTNIFFGCAEMSFACGDIKSLEDVVRFFDMGFLKLYRVLLVNEIVILTIIGG